MSPPSFSRRIRYAPIVFAPNLLCPPSPYTPAIVCFRITNDIWTNVMHRWVNCKVRWREGGREGGRDVRTCTVYVLTHVCMYAPVTCMYACTLHRQGVKARAETARKPAPEHEAHRPTGRASAPPVPRIRLSPRPQSLAIACLCPCKSLRASRPQQLSLLWPHHPSLLLPTSRFFSPSPHLPISCPDARGDLRESAEGNLAVALEDYARAGGARGDGAGGAARAGGGGAVASLQHLTKKVVEGDLGRWFLSIGIDEEDLEDVVGHFIKPENEVKNLRTLFALDAEDIDQILAGFSLGKRKLLKKAITTEQV